ncbi:MAG: hypothetical protein HZA54_11340 [Planctomycetes bacterium]|nr:hypothetical protein [Planctomycetota bacterium]
MSESQRAFLRALAARIVPPARSLSPAEEGRFFALIEEFLAGRPAVVRRQIGLFLAVLRWLPALRYFRPLDALPPERQDAVLRAFQQGPIGIFRKGFWGVKTLLYLGYYGRTEVYDQVNYRPTTAGNERLHART